MNTSITALYCCIDEFTKVFEECEQRQSISTNRKRQRPGKLSLSEMLFIMVLFHVSPFKNFKTFWYFSKKITANALMICQATVVL